MFLRIKKIKGNEYAYFSENRWMKRTKQVRQETKKYLGRVFRFEKQKEASFVFDDSLESLSPGELIRKVICHELGNHGFEPEKGKLCKDGCFVDLKANKVLGKNGKSVALGMNNGFLSDYTLGRLFTYNKIENSYDLAKLFVEAGLDVPKDAFVEIYKKVFKSFDLEEEIV